MLPMLSHLPVSSSSQIWFASTFISQRLWKRKWEVWKREKLKIWYGQFLSCLWSKKFLFKWDFIIISWSLSASITIKRRQVEQYKQWRGNNVTTRECSKWGSISPERDLYVIDSQNKVHLTIWFASRALTTGLSQAPMLLLLKGCDFWICINSIIQ